MQLGSCVCGRGGGYGYRTGDYYDEEVRFLVYGPRYVFGQGGGSRGAKLQSRNIPGSEIGIAFLVTA